MKRAWVLGATGATGAALVEQLLGSDEYSEVHVFVRRPLQLQHAKLRVHVVDMERAEDWQMGPQQMSPSPVWVRRCGQQGAKRLSIVWTWTTNCSSPRWLAVVGWGPSSCCRQLGQMLSHASSTCASRAKPKRVYVLSALSGRSSSALGSWIVWQRHEAMSVSVSY